MNDRLCTGHATHVGRVREHNEDSYVVQPEMGLWVVADGMGGHACGEVASAITVKEVTAAIRQGSSLSEAMHIAHTAVLNAAKSGLGKPGMGATVVALSMPGENYEITWVGDSRGYLWDGQMLQPLTRDHSYVQMLLDNHLIEQKDIKGHPMGYIVTQAIGSVTANDIDVDRVTGSLSRNECLLLCSDGLTDELSDEAIAMILKSGGNNQIAVDGLIEAALLTGGSDNITVVLVGTLQQPDQ